MTTLDVTKWSKRNVWRTPDGQLCVRPGLRRLATPTSAKWVGGFSVQNPWTLEVWHYIAEVDSDDTDLRVLVLDEDFVEWQRIAMGVDGVPRGFSFGIVEGEIVIGAIGMPTLWGFVGGHLQFATKVDSDNPGTTSINVPRGIVAAVCNRIVIADGATIYISDPVAITGGSPRTFVGQNQNQRPGVVFGLHEGAGDSLVAVTSAGVYALDSSAFAVQIVGSNGTPWRMVNSHQAHSYDSSASVRGRVYGLTRRGYSLIDTDSDAEVLLGDALQPRRYGIRQASPDWRSARLYAGEDGPIIADGDLCHMTDVAFGLGSWWGCDVASTFRVRGALVDPDGATMLLCEDGVYAIGGNVDGTQLLSGEAATQPRAVLAGVIPGDPEDNPTIRRLVSSAALGGVGTIEVAVRGQVTTAFPSSTPAADTRALVVGTSSWGDTAIYEPVPLASVRFDTNYNTDDVAIEATANLPATRLGPLLNVDVSASAPKRSPNRGAP